MFWAQRLPARVILPATVNSDTPKKRGKQPTKKKQLTLEFSHKLMEEPSSENSELSLMAVMDLLVDINCRLNTSEQVVDQLRAERKPQSLFLTCTTPGKSRGCTRRRLMTGPQHNYHEPVTEILYKVQVKVASQMRGAPVLELPNHG